MSFAGLLNKKCTIEVLTKTQNATTRQVVEIWGVAYSNVKCRLDGAESREFLGANKDVTLATHILFIENKYKLSMYKNRVKVDGIIYNILQITDGGGHGHHLELYLEFKQ
jgi:SPP1 family predicted phage head-tail adaptor